MAASLVGWSGLICFVQNNGVNNWLVGDLSIRQATDGYVMLERRNTNGSKSFLRVSPTNGKLKVETPSVQVGSLTLFSPGLS